MYWSIRWTVRQSQQGDCVSEVNTMVSALAKTQMAPKCTRGTALFGRTPWYFFWCSPCFENSPGDDFSQALLLLARRFLLAASAASILCSVLRHRAVRLSRIRGLTRCRWCGICLGRGVGGSRCRLTAPRILRRRWRVWIRRLFFASLCCWSNALRPARCPAGASHVYRRHDSRSGDAADSRLVPPRQNISSRLALGLGSHRRFSHFGRCAQLLPRPGTNQAQRL